MTLFFDICTVGTSLLALFSGLAVIAKFPEGPSFWSRMDVFGSTSVCVIHLVLMAYWSFQDGPAAIGAELDSAFNIFHIGAALILVRFHSRIARDYDIQFS